MTGGGITKAIVIHDAKQALINVKNYRFKFIDVNQHIFIHVWFSISMPIGNEGNMKRILLVVLVLMIAIIVTMSLPAFTQEASSSGGFHPRCPDRKTCFGGKKDRKQNLKEPSAAPDPYTDPDQESLERNKENWWGKGWTPPEESNPYHRW